MFNRNDETGARIGALQSAIFNSANFSSIATDAKGVIQIFNVGAERMLGYTAAEVMNKITLNEKNELLRAMNLKFNPRGLRGQALHQEAVPVRVTKLR